jgi:hypothetical protein
LEVERNLLEKKTTALEPGTKILMDHAGWASGSRNAFQRKVKDDERFEVALQSRSAFEKAGI